MQGGLPSSSSQPYHQADTNSNDKYQLLPVQPQAGQGKINQGKSCLAESLALAGLEEEYPPRPIWPRANGPPPPASGQGPADPANKEVKPVSDPGKRPGKAPSVAPSNTVAAAIAAAAKAQGGAGQPRSTPRPPPPRPPLAAAAEGGMVLGAKGAGQKRPAEVAKGGSSQGTIKRVKSQEEEEEAVDEAVHGAGASFTGSMGTKTGVTGEEMPSAADIAKTAEEDEEGGDTTMKSPHSANEGSNKAAADDEDEEEEEEEAEEQE